MKYTRSSRILGWSMLVALAGAACGGSDDDGHTGSGGSAGSGGAPGSTTVSCQLEDKLSCFELAVPAGGVQATTDQCTQDKGTPGTACPGGSIAECQHPIHQFYYTGFDAVDQAEQVCTGLGGTWVAH